MGNNAESLNQALHQNLDLQQIFQHDVSSMGHAGENSVPDILRAIRNHLNMEVAFVAEFTQGQRIFRYVDSDWQNNPIKINQGHPLGESYCQRVGIVLPSHCQRVAIASPSRCQRVAIAW